MGCIILWYQIYLWYPIYLCYILITFDIFPSLPFLPITCDILFTWDNLLSSYFRLWMPVWQMMEMHSCMVLALYTEILPWIQKWVTFLPMWHTYQYVNWYNWAMKGYYHFLFKENIIGTCISEPDKIGMIFRHILVKARDAFTENKYTDWLQVWNLHIKFFFFYCFRIPMWNVTVWQMLRKSWGCQERNWLPWHYCWAVTIYPKVYQE